MINNSPSLLRWNLLHAIFMVIAGIYLIVVDNVNGIYLMGTVSFAILFFVSRSSWMKLRPFGGYANHVTLIRLILLLLTYFWGPDSPWIVFGLLLSSIVLDAFDGYLARKYDAISEFGSFFDIETDAFFMLILTTCIYRMEFAGIWVLHAGLVRYYYILAKHLIGKHKIREPRINAIRYVAIAIFVLHFSPFILPVNFHFPLLIAGSVLLYGSFSYSLLILMKFRN